ncbi:MAG TPA: histidine kinase [Candidatus Coprenecus merdipullorum]|nr:histidine kinase [Candidatus Coprenecus merdipullorum]
MQDRSNLIFYLSKEVLKAQVNPHFLFNSLNILYSLIAIDRDKSREFTLQLLVENVTKHNVISVRNPMNVSVVLGRRASRFPILCG